MSPVAIVTSATHPFGHAAAIRLGGLGWDVGLLDREPERCGESEVRLAELGRRCTTVGADIADGASLRSAVARVRRELGDPTVLVNPLSFEVPYPVAEHDVGVAGWYADTDRALKGAFLTTRTLMDFMVVQGWGRIIHVADHSCGPENLTVTAALEGFVRTVAQELGLLNVLVNLVVQTPDTSTLTPLTSAEAAKQYPEHVADAVEFLVGGGAAGVAGQVLHMS